MPVLILVCDDEEVAAHVEELFLNATGAGPSKLLHPTLVGTLQEQREYSSIAKAVCAVLNIAADGSQLVQLLGGSAGMTNLAAAVKWCKTNISLLDHDLSGPALIDALASRLHDHLTSRMH